MRKLSFFIIALAISFLIGCKSSHEIEWCWVRGHSGNDGNERADALANRGAEMISTEEK